MARCASMTPRLHLERGIDDEVTVVASVNADAWDSILAQIREDVGEQRFNLWFRNTCFVEADADHIKVGVPNLFIKGWMEENFADTIEACASRACGWQGRVVFTVTGKLFRQMRSEQLAEGVADVSALGREKKPKEPPSSGGRLLTLDDFVIGACNQLAYAAALEACLQQNPAYTRVFVHGGVGLGKTHLLQGVWNKARQSSDDGQAIYTTAERWTNEYVYALRSNQMDAFRRKFRSVKVFLIDDIHFFKDNMKSFQEEFLHTFDALEASNKRIVIASDSHPRDLSQITKTLVTRFMSGMVAKLDAPDFGTRVQILAKKTKKTQYQFPNEVVEFIADRIANSVRELEGAVTTVIAYASLAAKPVDMALAREALSEAIRNASPVVTMRQIEDEAATALGLTRAELHSKRRTRNLSRARHICMYLARQLTHQSCRDIGGHFGNLTHTSVISACKNIDRRMGEDHELAAQLTKLRTRLQR